VRSWPDCPAEFGRALIDSMAFLSIKTHLAPSRPPTAAPSGYLLPPTQMGRLLRGSGNRSAGWALKAPRISSRDRHIGARRPPEDQGRRPPVSLHCVTARVSEPERHSSGPETAAHRRGRSRLRAAHRSRYYGGLRMNMIARTAMLAAARSPDHDSSSMPPGGMMPAGVIRAGPTGPNILR
jgi:hypothetical protein